MSPKKKFISWLLKSLNKRIFVVNSYNHPTPEEIYENITNTFLNSCEKRTELEKLPIKPFDIPKKLYQYRRFDENGYNINNLKSSQIWCSSVKNFNDLYEGTVKTPSNEDLFSGTFKRRPDLRKKYRNTWCRLSKEQKEKMISSTKHLTNKVAKNIFAVSCFTRNNSCHPMWAHYADTHEGFCVEFDFSTLELDKWLWLYPVAYSNEKIYYRDSSIYENNCIPKKDCPKCEKSVFTKCFATKATDWEYEREWRMLTKNPKFGQVENYLETDFDGVTQDVSGCITGIYLGAKTEPKNEEQMIAIAKEKNIPIYKKEPSHDSFELQDKKIWSPN